MKTAYPIVLTPDEPGYLVYIPDFNINTEGNSLAEAMEMARDAIGLMGIDMENDHKSLPSPSSMEDVFASSSDIVTLVDVDFDEYRRKNDLRTVRRNVTLPSWLNAEANRAGLNVSALLQRAIKQELHLTDR